MKLIVKKVKPAKRGITILFDSRETRPILFQKDDPIVSIQRTKLDCGDYQALFPDGSRSWLIFERKSIADLWGTMTKGHTRFMKEHGRSPKGSGFIVIVEAPFSRILAGFDRSKYPGEILVRKLWMLWKDHGIFTVFCQSRQDMANYISHAFISEYRYRWPK